jgi:hypothetical protein
MIGTGGVLSGLVAKAAGVGTPAKALIALGLMATTVTGAGAATGALPGPAQSAVASVVNAISPLDIPTGDDGGSVVAGVNIAGGPADSGVSVDASTPAGSSADAGVSGSAGSGNSGGRGSAGGTAAVTPPDLSSVPVPNLPDVPGLPELLGSLPVDIPRCATSIIDPATGNLLVAPDQLASKVMECVKSMVPAGSIPPSVSRCLTSLLSSLQGVLGGGVPSGVPSLDVSSCVPVDVSPCVESIVGAVGANPMAIIGNLGSLPDLAKLFDVGALDGCVPVSAAECVSSILGSFGSGNVTSGIRLDLSACLPASLNGTVSAR